MKKERKKKIKKKMEKIINQQIIKNRNEPSNLKKDVKLFCDGCGKDLKNEPIFKVWWIFDMCQDCYNTKVRVG